MGRVMWMVSQGIFSPAVAKAMRAPAAQKMRNEVNRSCLSANSTIPRTTSTGIIPSNDACSVK